MENQRRKPAKLIDEKPPNPDEEPRKRIDNCGGININRKIVNKKPPNLVGVIRRKPTPL